MTSDPAPASDLKSWLTLGLCAALLILFASLSYSASLTKNATYDEPLHAASGYAIRAYGDYRIDPEDPAFFTWLSALPHASGALKFDDNSPAMQNVTKVHDEQWIQSIKTLYQTPGNDPDAYFNKSRFLFMLFGIACGALVCWWGWNLAGRVGAFAATACYALDPNFIGHSSLVKNDVPLALVTVGLTFALWRAGRRATWWNLAAICIALAAAMNVKFSGPVFFAITFIALMLRAVMPEKWPVLRWELRSWLARLVMPFGVCFVAGLVAYISIWACYGFRYAPTKDPNVHFDFDAIVQRCKSNLWQRQYEGKELPKISNEELLAEIKKIPTPTTATVVQSLEDHKLLPEAWLDGFFFTYATTRMRGSFLNGEHSITGWWYFFPAAVIYKTPTAVLAVAILALIAPLVIWARRGLGPWDILTGLALVLVLARVVLFVLQIHRTPQFNSDYVAVIVVLVLVRLVPIMISAMPLAEWWDLICLLTPVVIYGGMAILSNFNLGIRHVLPLLPFLHLAVAIAVSRLIWRWGKIGALLAGGLGMALAVESCSAWPNYIAFFNAPSGGTRNAVFKLSDSNLDWGQDLKLLAEWHKAHPDKLLYLCYFGTADPSYYGINRIDLPGGYVFASQLGMPQAPGIIAMSATNLQGTYMTKELRNLYAPLHKIEPRDILGGTIYLYDWPLRPPTTQQ